MLVSEYAEPKRRPAARKYDLNESYFDVIGPAQAYWLGYLLADGNVALRKRDGVVRQFVLQAASKDREHLEKLRTAVGAGHPLYGPYANVWQFAVPSYRLCVAVEKYGVVPNKSLIAEPPVLPDNLYWHWLRGLIDGDGSFNRYHRPSRAVKRNGRGRPATAGQDVLMLSVVGSAQVTAKLYADFGGSWRPKANVWSWSINDRRAAEVLAGAYGNSTATTRLDRKYESAVRLGIVTEDVSAGLPI